MVSAQDNAAAFATITTIGSSVGVVFHVTKVHRSLAALS
jgi:hypothetical protein